MRGMTKGKAALLAGAVALVGSAMWGGPAQAEDITINMAAPDWPPTRIMQDMANASYQAPSGNTVTLVIDFIPWPDYYTRLAASLTSGEEKYQMAVSDSQWLGANIEGGYYMKINDFIDADPGLQAVFEDLHPNLVASYSTYPHRSENYYGFPQMPDVLVVYYREDLFCHEGEMAAFKEKYGYDLPCSPEEHNEVHWDQVADFGEFFRRGSGDSLGGEALTDDFYGIAYQAGKGYDFSSMQINGFIWQHGGSIWDETMEPEGQALGVVNSDVAVEAFEHYLSLTQHMPPVVQTGSMDIFKVDELFREGKVAWINPVDRLRRIGDLAGYLEGLRPGQLRQDARPQGGRRDRALVQHRRAALRADHLEQRHGGPRVARLLQVVALHPRAARVRLARRAERPEERLHHARVHGVPAVEPRLRPEPRLAEGRLAHPRVLRAAGAAAGGIRQGDHRTALRQGGAGQHRRIPG